MITPVPYHFADDGKIPNHPVLPLLVYERAVDPAGPDLATAFEDLFTANGWPAAWRDGIYAFAHYHSTAHEVLGIATGQVRVRFGGERGVVLELRAGDAVLIPAGVGHQRISHSPELLVVGAYPTGQEADLCRGQPGERPRVLASIRTVPDWLRDPVLGAG